MERTGCKSQERARNKIEHCFVNGLKLRKSKREAKDVDKIYGHGFVLVVKDNLIITIYRPTTPVIKEKIYAAHRKKRLRSADRSGQGTGTSQAPSG